MILANNTFFDNINESLRELECGMLVAINCNNFPKVGRVVALSSQSISVQWLKQERTPTKPKWLRFFKESKGKEPPGTITYDDIVLYDFQLTAHGALKKKTREYLQKVFKHQ